MRLVPRALVEGERGRYWVAASLACLIASYAKLIGLGLLPLLLTGASATERREVGARVALALYLIGITPLIVWNMGNSWCNFGFQFREGLWHHDPPGLLGIATQQIGQAGVVSPLVYLAILAVAFRMTLVQSTTFTRLAWWTLAPVLLSLLPAAPLRLPRHIGR